MILTIIIAVVIVLFDQVTKILVLNNLGLFESRTVINNFFYITHTENSGMGFSMFDDQTLFLAVLSTVMAGFFIYYLYNTIKNDDKTHKLFIISIALIIGGTIGNMIDRWMTVVGSRGGVIDFLEFYIFGANNDPFAIFNIADSALVVGVILLIIEILFRDKDKLFGNDKKDNKDTVTDEVKNNTNLNLDSNSKTENEVSNNNGSTSTKEEVSDGE